MTNSEVGCFNLGRKIMEYDNDVVMPEEWEIVLFDKLNKIEEAWNEAEELNCSLRELNDDDLVDCRQALIERTKKIMNLLNEEKNNGIR